MKKIEIFVILLMTSMSVHAQYYYISRMKYNVLLIPKTLKFTI